MNLQIIQRIAKKLELSIISDSRDNSLFGLFNGVVHADLDYSLNLLLYAPISLFDKITESIAVEPITFLCSEDNFFLIVKLDENILESKIIEILQIA